MRSRCMLTVRLHNQVSDEYRETTIELVQLEAARFDKMQAAIWQKAEERRCACC